MKVYTVDAFKNGNREDHSYLLGVYSTEEKSKKEARKEEIRRGNEYKCEIIEWDLDSKEHRRKVIKIEYDFEKRG